ncbi:MAG: hypothetical protein WAU34_15230, partial [Desulfobacterales bacterium]
LTQPRTRLSRSGSFRFIKIFKVFSALSLFKEKCIARRFRFGKRYVTIGREVEKLADHTMGIPGRGAAGRDSAPGRREEMAPQP